MNSESGDEKSRTLSLLWGVALSLGVLIVHALSYLPFMTDDAFISLRYARRLLQGQGFTWTAGEAVEGYTNFLWVIATAALGWFHVELVDAARILGLFGMAATLIAAMLCGRNPENQRPWPALIAGLGIALAGPVAVWAVGGLEQPLLVALLAWVFFLLFRRIDRREIDIRHMILPGLLLGLICLTRADGALFTIAVCLAWLAARGLNKEAIRLTVVLAAIAFVAFAAHLLFRLSYYGQWIPNTALIKTQFSPAMLLRGIKYLIKGLLYMGPLLVFALIALLQAFRSKGMRPKVVLLSVVGILWSGYVVLIGGDYFVAHRHLTPLVLIVSILAAFGVQAMMDRFRTGRIALLVAGVILVSAYAFLQITAPANHAARLERWEFNGEVVGKLLKAAFADRQPLMAVTAAGALPYYSDLPVLDMLGLNDRHIASNPPEDLTAHKPAHQFGDGQYVLSRKPDLVVFCEPGGCIDPIYRSGLEMVKDPRWGEFYRLVRFEGRDPFLYHAKIYVRAEDGRIGIEREEGRIRVPGYLLSGNPNSVARLDDGGRIAMTANRDTPARMSDLKVPKGNWTLTITASSPVSAELRIAGTPVLFHSDSHMLQFELADPGAVDLAVRAKSEDITFIYEVGIDSAEEKN